MRTDDWVFHTHMGMSGRGTPITVYFHTDDKYTLLVGSKSYPDLTKKEAGALLGANIMRIGARRRRVKP